MLCRTFQYLSKSTWSLLRRGRKQGVQINEETITNLLILRLQETTGPYLRVKSFTKKEESRTGADWEWWVGLPGNWVGFRLQAKVSDFRSDCFEHLYYTLNGGVPQYERLLNDAIHAWPRRVPLYCLYVHWQQSFGFRRSSRAGCSLLSPMVVRSLAHRRVRCLADLYQYTTPWHELVCPGNRSPVRQSLAAGVIDRARQLYKETGIEDGAEDAGALDPNQTTALQDLMRDVRPTSDVPDYVMAVRAGEQPIIGNDAHLNAVTVFEELPGGEPTEAR